MGHFIRHGVVNNIESFTNLIGYLLRGRLIKGKISTRGRFCTSLGTVLFVSKLNSCLNQLTLSAVPYEDMQMRYFFTYLTSKIVNSMNIRYCTLPHDTVHYIADQIKYVKGKRNAHTLHFTSDSLHCTKVEKRKVCRRVVY